MTIKERFAEAAKKIETLEDCKAILQIFNDDLNANCELYDKVYSIFGVSYKLFGRELLKDLALISKKYVNSCSEYTRKYELYYIILLYYYSVGDFEQVALFSSKFSESGTPGDYTLAAYTLKVNVLQYLGLYQEAQEGLNFVLNSKNALNASDYMMGVLMVNAIQITSHNKDKKKTFEYLNKLIESFDKVDYDGKGKDIVVKTAYFYANIYSNLDNPNVAHAYGDEFYEYIMNNYMYTDFVSEDSETYIQIISSLSDYYTEEQVYNICKKLIDEMKPIFRDRLTIYNYLFENKNPYYLKNEEMRADHLQSAYDFHKSNRGVYADSLREVLRLQLIEEKLNLLETKYNGDALTECLNRNYLVSIENRIINNSVVCYIDLDSLKKVNDEYGHSNGDIYLKVFSKLLRKVFAQECYEIIRYGGDEFVIICNRVDVDVVKQKIEELIGNCNTVSLDSINLKTISFSCGIYEVAYGMTVSEAVGRADTVMYECKEKRKHSSNWKYSIN